jgi:hypothetical protein
VVFYQKHIHNTQLRVVILGVDTTGPFLFIIILIILLFDHFRDRLGYCLAASSKQFEHLKAQNNCPPL